MKQTQVYTLAMLEHALKTATHNPPPNPPPDFPIILAELASTIERAKTTAVTQAADRGSSSAALRDARNTLIDRHLIPIRDIAIGRLGTIPSIRRLFRVPIRLVNLTTLLKEATVTAEHAAQYQDVFIASGLPADFITRLNVAIAQVTQGKTTRANTRQDQVKATQSLKDILKQGKQLVLGLNGIMQIAFADDPAVLAVWNSARHIRRTATPEVPANPADAKTKTEP